MRLLFLTKYYPPSEGGIERYGHVLCTGLVQRGMEVEVVAFAEESGPTVTESVDGVPVHRLARRLNVGRAPFSFALPSRLRRSYAGCDLVHLNFPNPWMEVCHLALCPGRPTVVSYHSDVVKQGLLRAAYLPVARRLLRRSAAVIASSPAYADSSDLLSENRDRCRIIPYPVDTAYLQNADPQAVASRREQHGAFVLFCGRLVHYKGLEYLIEAIGRLAGVKLLVVGRGPEEGRHRQRVASLGLGERVEFLGRVGEDELRTLYHACECFALPSVDRSESFGIVLAEAMTCGAPVVSTEVGSGTSFINVHGETGFVVAPRDAGALAEAIARIVGNGELRNELGREARVRAEARFRREVVIDQTVQLYGEVLAAA